MLLQALNSWPTFLIELCKASGNSSYSALHHISVMKFGNLTCNIQPANNFSHFRNGMIARL